MGLKKLMTRMELDAPEPGERELIKECVDAYIAKGGDHEDREKGFHVSGMCFFCPRQFLLQVLTGVEGFTVEPSLQRIFDIGHAMHYWYQDHYLGPAGVLLGFWECLHCDLVMEGAEPENCLGCGRGRRYMTYREIGLRDESFGIVIDGKPWPLLGHTDGIVVIDDHNFVLEIKTIKPEEFAKLREPKYWNEYQLQVYMHLLHKQFGRILYICKSTGDTKEYEVEADQQPWMDVESKIGAVRRFIKMTQKSGEIELGRLREIRGSCTDESSRSAKSCPFVDICLKGESCGIVLPATALSLASCGSVPTETS